MRLDSFDNLIFEPLDLKGIEDQVLESVCIVSLGTNRLLRAA